MLRQKLAAAEARDMVMRAPHGGAELAAGLSVAVRRGVPYRPGMDQSKLIESSFPHYQSHKIVQAAKIVACYRDDAGGCKLQCLLPHGDTGRDDVVDVIVPPEFWNRHDPQPGGYLVRYADGYLSWSPASAFEGGYLPLGESGDEDAQLAVQIDKEPALRRLTSHVAALAQHDPERERRIEELEAAKNGAYAERDRLVCALSKVFPSWLARHPDDDTSWDNDWRWIVFVQLPTGQASWHIHDSERGWFDHLLVGENSWDGHTTEEKYDRVAALMLRGDDHPHPPEAKPDAAVGAVVSSRPMETTNSSFPILEHFKYEHLPPALQEVSKPFCDLARDMVMRAPHGGAELAAGLRKLLEAKDCCVRAVRVSG